MRPRKKLEGYRFGRLYVEEYVNGRYKCLCDCGNTKYILGSNLVSGDIRSCGCLRKETSRKKRKTHGHSKERIYRIWKAMRKRCNDKNDSEYKNYGGRGIKVYEEWNKSFESFYDWAMNNGYSENLTIDRIDVNGNYCPENCRWATWKEQGRNKRKTKYFTLNGVKKALKDWCEIYGVCYCTAKHRIEKQHLTGEEVFK